MNSQFEAWWTSCKQPGDVLLKDAEDAWNAAVDAAAKLLANRRTAFKTGPLCDMVRTDVLGLKTANERTDRNG